MHRVAYELRLFAMSVESVAMSFVNFFITITLITSNSVGNNVVSFFFDADFPCDKLSLDAAFIVLIKSPIFADELMPTIDVPDSPPVKYICVCFMLKPVLPDAS